MHSYGPFHVLLMTKPLGIVSHYVAMIGYGPSPQEAKYRVLGFYLPRPWFLAEAVQARLLRRRDVGG